MNVRRTVSLALVGAALTTAIAVPAAAAATPVDAPSGSVLDLLEAHARDIVLTGERAWFRSIGIEPEFWSRED